MVFVSPFEGYATDMTEQKSQSQQLEFFEIPSPCIGVCESGPRGFCKGCYRSRDERLYWLKVDDATKNHTLVRKNFVLSGNTNWDESAGASDADTSEWLVYDVNTFVYGGSHLNTYCDNFINITNILSNLSSGIRFFIF